VRYKDYVDEFSQVTPVTLTLPLLIDLGIHQVEGSSRAFGPISTILEIELKTLQACSKHFPSNEFIQRTISLMAAAIIIVKMTGGLQLCV
jgi:hypothetical protein